MAKNQAKVSPYSPTALVKTVGHAAEYPVAPTGFGHAPPNHTYR